MTRPYDRPLNADAAISVEISSVLDSLERLERVTRSLRFVGLIAFLLTVGCVVLTFVSAFNMPHVSSSSYTAVMTSRILFYFSLILGASALLCVMFYELTRKQGYSLFEEISDELEWHVQDKVSSDRRSEARPELRARIVLRSFARTTDLPLVPGQFGPTLYATINLVAIFGGVLISRLVL